MKFNQSQISEIIQMAWDDQTDFSHIKKIYEIDEGDVKKIMKKNNFKSLIQYLPGILILIYVFFLAFTQFIK